MCLAVDHAGKDTLLLPLSQRRATECAAAAWLLQIVLQSELAEEVFEVGLLVGHLQSKSVSDI